MNILRFFIPEAIIVVTALLVLLVDLTFTRHKSLGFRNTVIGTITCLGCLAAVVWLVLSPNVVLFGEYIVPIVKEVVLGLTIFTAIISFDSKFTRHVGEYFALLLLASTGLMILVGSYDLLMVFVGLELLSISLYAMTALNKESIFSSEAALKYFLFGGMSAAFTLYGISLIYGIFGDISLIRIPLLFYNVHEPLFYLALVMTLIGFAFKLAAAPFHLWTPDVYQGAPTPIAAFIASGSKVGSFYIVARILLFSFMGNHGSAAWGHVVAGWMPIIAIIAVVSLIVGNIAALVQSNVKRLLAYSAVAHAGYALLAFFGEGNEAYTSLLFYVITYALTVMGAFAVVSVVENNSNGSHLENFAGLSRRSPIISACMAVFLLSLAGIPPLSGFFGKFYVFKVAMAGTENLGLIWLVILAISASAISLYYYLQVLKQIYVMENPARPVVISAGKSTQAAIIILAVAVIALGCFPDLLLGRLTATLEKLPF